MNTNYETRFIEDKQKRLDTVEKHIETLFNRRNHIRGLTYPKKPNPELTGAYERERGLIHNLLRICYQYHTYWSLANSGKETEHLKNLREDLRISRQVVFNDTAMSFNQKPQPYSEKLRTYAEDLLVSIGASTWID